MSLIGETTPAADLIKEGADATFAQDVIEASRQQPVIVDFWAPWCGPCRQLGPALERVVTAAKGAVKMVKIDIDKNPVFAGQLRVQSIPAVFAFVDGRPVDAFMGALANPVMSAAIDQAVSRRGEQPRFGRTRHSVVGPFRQCGEQRIAERVFCAGHVAGARCEIGNQTPVRVPRHRFDRAMHVAGRCGHPVMRACTSGASGRTSTAPYVAAGQRDAHSMAASSVGSSRMMKPASCSFVSA